MNLSVPPRPWIGLGDAASLPSTPTSDVPAPLVSPTPVSLLGLKRRNDDDDDDDDNSLAIQLRRATAECHQTTIMSRTAMQLVTGQLDQSLHAKYLMMLLIIYSELERALSEHPSHNVLSPVYDPMILARQTGLEQDLAWYAGDDWQHSQFYQELLDGKVEPVLRYRDRLRTLSSQDPSLLLAHAYVRYLGDLSGGQQIARGLRKRYALPQDQGTSFYEFDYRDPNGQPARATTAETKKTKAWFRNGLDEAGLRMTEVERQRVVDEAKLAYDLNIAMLRHFEPQT